MHRTWVAGAQPAKSAASALTIVFAHVRNARTRLQPRPAPLLLRRARGSVDQTAPLRAEHQSGGRGPFRLRGVVRTALAFVATIGSAAQPRGVTGRVPVSAARCPVGCRVIVVRRPVSHAASRVTLSRAESESRRPSRCNSARLVSHPSGGAGTWVRPRRLSWVVVHGSGLRPAPVSR